MAVFHFFEMYKWHQIVQRTTYGESIPATWHGYLDSRTIVPTAIEKL